MKKIIGLILLGLLVGCGSEPAPTVGKILGVKQMLSNDQIYEVGIMVHADFIPYCTNNFELADRAQTMIGQFVEVEWALQEGSACPIIIDFSLYED